MFNKITYKDHYYYENFIDDEIQKFFLNWIKNNEDDFMGKNNSKKVVTLDRSKNQPIEVLNNLREKVVNIENLKDYIEPKIRVNFLAVYGIDSECTIHRDDISDLDNWNHVRYNVLISKAEQGGETIMGDEVYDFPEKSIWRCFASGVHHGSKKILSEKPRIVLSLGFLIKKSS